MYVILLRFKSTYGTSSLGWCFCHHSRFSEHVEWGLQYWVCLKYDAEDKSLKKLGWVILLKWCSYVFDNIYIYFLIRLSTGYRKPVYVVGAEHCTWKFSDFQKSLQDRGAVRPLTGKEDVSCQLSFVLFWWNIVLYLVIIPSKLWSVRGEVSDGPCCEPKCTLLTTS